MRSAGQFHPEVISLFRRRAIVACACAAGATLAAPAAEGAQEQFALQRTYLNQYEKAKRQGANPGRNILLEGVTTKKGHVRVATKGELNRSLRILRRMTGGSSSSSASPQLEAIAQCESGGDPTAIGGGGLYRGKYQFSVGTWQSVGGSGDPAAAPEAEQDKRAAMLLARSGTGQWPVCGA
jgi:hypothetical protein